MIDREAGLEWAEGQEAIGRRTKAEMVGGAEARSDTAQTKSDPHILISTENLSEIILAPDLRSDEVWVGSTEMSDENASAIVWFRRDLRLSDNPAFQAASKNHRAIIPLYIHDPEAEGPWVRGAASEWWLARSLESLAGALKELGVTMVFRRGQSEERLREVLDELGNATVYWNRIYEPWAIERDSKLKSSLRDDGIQVRSFNGSALLEPGKLRNQSGEPYRVFTAFWRAARRTLPDHPEPIAGAPKKIREESNLEPRSESEIGLESSPHWARKFEKYWEPGEAGALKALDRFCESGVDRYADERDIPSVEGVSRLSPRLALGELSPWRVLKKLQESLESRGSSNGSWKESVFASQLGWREFSVDQLYHFPDSADTSLRREFENFPWRSDSKQLEAWRRGQTGYPLVDAGMRELWETGWMHNRVRMVVASFLVKHLRIHWLEGARWFWDTLVDADLANNTMGWQWTAGCGADAAPYFRVFNPYRQSERFDPNAEYIRKWVPELRDAPLAYCLDPTKPKSRPPSGYPAPIVDHAESRKLALEAYHSMKG